MSGSNDACLDVQQPCLALQSVEPEEVMVLLNNLFSIFDELTDQCMVHKVSEV